MKYQTRDREAGNIIDTFDSEQEALTAIKEYEKADQYDDCFVINFYEVVVSE